MTCPNKAKAAFRPFSHLQHPREVIRQFTPNWFAATMGTGVLALALAQLPVHIPGVHAFAEGLWLFNIGLFILFSVLYGARWVLYFDEARRIFGHSTVSMFFGTIPMGLATIIVGNGLFKANAANMVRRIYEGDDAKIDSAFTLYYMAVNIGSTVSMLLPRLTPMCRPSSGAVQHALMPLHQKICPVVPLRPILSFRAHNLHASRA
mgnify:CR=1 FL=1